METIKNMEDLPMCLVRGTLSEEHIEWFESLGFFVDISPGDKVIYSCFSDSGVITQQKPTGKLSPSLLGIPNLRGVMGLEDFIDCGKCIECFIDIIDNGINKQFPFKWNTVIKDFPPFFKKGEVRINLEFRSDIPPSFYRKSTSEEILKNYRHMYPKKWKAIDIPSITPPELLSLD